MRYYHRRHTGHHGAAVVDDQVACVVVSNAWRSCLEHSTLDIACGEVPSRV